MAVPTVKIITANSADELQTKVNQFLVTVAGGAPNVLDMDWSMIRNGQGSTFTCCITYQV